MIFFLHQARNSSNVTRLSPEVSSSSSNLWSAFGDATSLGASSGACGRSRPVEDVHFHHVMFVAGSARMVRWRDGEDSNVPYDWDK